MIRASLEYLIKELESSLELGETNVSINSLKGLPDKHGQGILFSFISLDEEEAPQKLPNFPIDKNKGFNVAPSLALNMKLAIVFDFNDYGRSLECLSEVAEFFRSKGMFTVENSAVGNTFPAGLTRLHVSPESMDLERLSWVWGMLGSRHYPALLYNVRLMNVEEGGSEEEL